MRQVTDPALLAQLNGTSKQGADEQLLSVFEPEQAPQRPKKKVTDPALLSRLNSKENQDNGEEQGIARTAFDQSMQGATFGFSDEVQDRIGALIASTYTGEKYEDLIKVAREASKSRLSAQFEQNPGTAIAANLAGAIGTGIAGGATKAGTALANTIRTGGLAARVAKTGLAGAASGTLAGAGTADDGRILEGAGTGAAIGGVLGGAAPVVGNLVSSAVTGSRNASKGISARSIDELEKTGAALKQTSSDLYAKSRQLGAVLNPQKAQNVITEIDAALTKLGKNNDRLHGDTLSVFEDFKTAASNEISLEELDQYRQLFQDAVSKNTDGIKGMNPDALKSSKAIEAIDDIVGKLSGKDLSGGSIDAVKALREGRKQWAKFRKFDVVANIIKQADGDPNKLKSALQRFVNKPKNLRGFTMEEKQKLIGAAKNSAGEKLLKALGKFGFDLGGSLTPGNTFLPVASSLAGGAGVPGGFALAGGGTLARQLQKLVGRGKAEEVLKLIEGSAQSTKAITKSSRTPKALPGTIPSIPLRINITPEEKRRTPASQTK